MADFTKGKNEHIEHLNKKHPGVDVEKLFGIFEKQLEKVQVGAFETNHTLTFPLGCDLNKTILTCIIDEYINGPKPEEVKVEKERTSTSGRKDVFEEATKLMRLADFDGLRKMIVSYTNEEADLGEMRMLLVPLKSLKGSPEVGKERQALLELLEKRIGHKLV